MYHLQIAPRLPGTIALSVVLLMTSAHAATLTLTAAGVDDGFTLSTFATMNPGYNGCCAGPFGVAVTASGNILVSDGATNLRYAFADVDGQTPSSALNRTTSNSGTTAYASAGGQAYGSNGSGRFVQFNDDGTANHALTGVAASPYLGMWGNPVNGHILASSSAGLIDIDPLSNAGLGSYRVVNAGGNGDGVSVSPDGTVVYSAQGSVIYGYSIATGQRIFTSPGLNSPDGAGVISSNNMLNGQIIVANNNGEVDLINPLTNTLVVIASGGTRLDYTSPDVTNGTLFIDSADLVYRLSCGTNCGIGSVSSTPEPSTISSAVLACSTLVFLARRRRTISLNSRKINSSQAHSLEDRRLSEDVSEAPLVE